MSIHMMRHGAVENPKNLRYGRLAGFGLSVKGRGQAKAAGEHLARAEKPIQHVVSSPLDRAVETANIVREELGLGPKELVIDDRFIEAESQFDGKSRMAFLYPWHWWRLRNPLIPSWAEPFGNVAERMMAGLTALRERWPGGQILVVSHQSPIWIARQALEQPGPPWRRRMHCAHASVTTFRFEDGKYAGYSYWAPAEAA